MLPRAFADSAEFIIDPLYSSAEKNPPGPERGEGVWLYGQYEFEAFLLERMFREKNEAKLKVGYTQYRRIPASTVCFEAGVERSETLLFRTSGRAQLTFEGKLLAEFQASDAPFEITLPGAGKLEIKVSVDDVERNIPALWIENTPGRWRCSVEGRDETFAIPRFPEAAGEMPHHRHLPQVELTPRKMGANSWDAGVELFCYVDIRCAETEKPELFFGESLPEMENCDPAHEEQTRELVQKGPGCWSGKVPLALRYIRVENAPSAQVTLRALFHPVAYRGAFAAPGNDDLTRIWLHSAYTLRLCMMNFLNDGIKRDRLPWAGDLAVSLMGCAYSFADRELVRDSLAVLGAVSVRQAHINTIADYTLWHLISHDLYQKYFGDMPFLVREYPRLADTMNFLLESRTPDGLFAPERPQDWVFIDWVPGEKTTALQMLFIMALRSAAALAQRMQDSAGAARMSEAAEKACEAVVRLCFDPVSSLFREAPGSGGFSRHANMLAVVAGVADEKCRSVIAGALTGKELPPVGTPYMSVFEALAVARCGRSPEALAKIREIWGGMLELGATSFWEGFDPEHTGNEHLVFYERPYGKSLCHAWSSGPLFLLPEMLLRIRPEKDGWEEFSIDPLPGVTLSAVIPVPQGRIEVECVEGRIIKLDFPAGCRRV